MTKKKPKQRMIFTGGNPSCRKNKLKKILKVLLIDF